MTDATIDTGRSISDLAPGDVQAGVAVFLAHEAELVDARHYDAWLELIEEDYTYRVPVPRTPDTPFAPHYDRRTLLIDENRWSLREQWFKRLAPEVYEMSWAENPPVRFRHFVTNVRAYVTDTPDEFDVRSNLLLMGVRQSTQPKFLTGQRFDTLRRRDGQLRLAERWVVLDQVVVDFPQLRILL